MLTQEELLNLYQHYDYLNARKRHPIIKILVSYIKPSFLFKSQILTPIHLGRAVEKETSKDGIQSGCAINWLHENCIGDDDFEGNISATNRKVGFLTGTYWAWKNYEKLKNPDYFGSFGYRRLFAPCFLENFENYDAVIPEADILFEKNLKRQTEKWHGTRLVKIMQATLNKVHPEDKFLFSDYLSQNKCYFREIYVMKKKLFFEFCQWIFPLLFELLNLPPKVFYIEQTEFEQILLRRRETKESFLQYKMRDIAFIIERLTGFFLFKLTNQTKNKILISKVITTNTDKKSIKDIIAGLRADINLLNQQIDKIMLYSS